MKQTIFPLVFFFLCFTGLLAQDQVTLYKDCNFRGVRKVLSPGDYMANEIGIGNDDLASLRIPRCMEVTVYMDNSFRGRSTRLTGNVACLGSDWNDQVSSVRVKRSGGGYGNSSESITVYADCNYRGRSHVLSLGTHGARDLGVGNDQISSIRVPSGLEVTLYQDDGKRGRNTKLSRDVSCLTSLSGNWNDAVSSINISRSSGGGYQSGNNRPSYGGSDRSITVYADCDFRGRSHELTLGTHRSNDLGIGNDQISSLRIPDGLEVTVYMDDSKRGRNMKLERDVSCLKDISGSWNDAISSINVSRSSGGSSYRPGNNRPSYGGGSSDQTITLYGDCDYRGARKELRQGTYNAYELGVGNDQLSSIRVPDGMEVILYVDDRQRGRSHEVHGDVSCLKDMGSEWNDNVSSIRVRKLRGYSNSNYNHYSSSSDGEVTLYVDADYGGRSISLRPGSYPSLSREGFPNDALSSIKIPYGYHAIVYTDEDFRGAHLKLIISSKRMIFNDKISSIEIIRND